MRLNTLALLTSVYSLSDLDTRSATEYEPLNGLNQTTYEFSLDPEPQITSYESEVIRDFDLPFSDKYQYIEYLGHFSSPNDDTFDVNLIANCTTYTNFDLLNVEALASHPLDVSSLLSSPQNTTIHAHVNEKYPLLFSLYIPPLEHVAVQLEITNLNTSEKLNFSDLIFAPNPMDTPSPLFARDSDSNFTSYQPFFAAMTTSSAASPSTVSTANKSSTKFSNSQAETQAQTQTQTQTDSDSENETEMGANQFAAALVSGDSSSSADEDQSMESSSSSESQASNEDIPISSESNVSSSALDSSIIDSSTTSENPPESLTSSSQEEAMKKSIEYELIPQPTSSGPTTDQVAEPTSTSPTLNTSIAAPKSVETNSKDTLSSSGLSSSSIPESSSSVFEANEASQVSETSSVSPVIPADKISEANPTSEATSTLTSLYTSSGVTKTVEVPVFATETSKAHTHQSSSESYSNISMPSQSLSGSSKASTNSNVDDNANANTSANAEQQTGSGAPIVTTMVQVSTLHSVITVNKNTIDFQYLTSSTITTTLPADYVFSSTERSSTTVPHNSASAPTNSSLRSKANESESQSATKSRKNGSVRLQPLLRFCALPLSVALLYGC